MITLSGEEIIQQMNEMDNGYIPSLFLPGGMPEGLFSRFFYVNTPIPLQGTNFDSRPHATEAARRATSIHVPS